MEQPGVVPGFQFDGSAFDRLSLKIEHAALERLCLLEHYFEWLRLRFRRDGQIPGRVAFGQDGHCQVQRFREDQRESASVIGFESLLREWSLGVFNKKNLGAGNRMTVGVRHDAGQMESRWHC